MPRPAYEILRKQRDAALRVLGHISTDPGYGVKVYQALDYEIERLHIEGQTPMFVLLLTVENMAGLVRQHGRHAATGIVKRVLGVRSSIVLLRACGPEPEEFVFVTGAHPELIIEQLRATCNKAGVTPILATTPYTGDIHADIRHCQAISQARREGYPA